MTLIRVFRVEGQVAVVTGAASGIGEATALVLAQAGAAVVAVTLTSRAQSAPPPPSSPPAGAPSTPVST